MRKFIFYTLTAGLILAMSSCCTKKQCLGADDLYEIQLLNFAPSEVDSIAFETFSANSNFASKIDSSLTNARGRGFNDTDLIIFLPKKINTSHEYRVTILRTGQVYKLTNFATRKEECNCPSDKYNVLVSYSVNGRRENSSSITITK